MKREILFKAVKHHTNEWVEGFYLKQNGRGIDGSKDSDIHQILDSGGSMQIIKPETLCQFTGRTYKETHKIFEGDTFYYGCDMIFNVIFEGGQFECEQNAIIPYWIFEPIGNIHDIK